jgi:hypothetical protein
VSDEKANHIVSTAAHMIRPLLGDSGKAVLILVVDIPKDEGPFVLSTCTGVITPHDDPGQARGALALAAEAWAKDELTKAVWR